MPLSRAVEVRLEGWPFDAAEARRRQAAAGPGERRIDLGDGVTLKLVRIPAGDFVMGDPAGHPDERPLTRVRIARDFWMGACEVTNEQLRRFDPTFDPRYYGKLHGTMRGNRLHQDFQVQPQ